MIVDAGELVTLEEGVTVDVREDVPLILAAILEVGLLLATILGEGLILGVNVEVMDIDTATTLVEGEEVGVIL